MSADPNAPTGALSESEVQNTQAGSDTGGTQTDVGAGSRGSDTGIGQADAGAGQRTVGAQAASTADTGFEEQTQVMMAAMGLNTKRIVAGELDHDKEMRQITVESAQRRARNAEDHDRALREIELQSARNAMLQAQLNNTNAAVLSNRQNGEGQENSRVTLDRLLDPSTIESIAARVASLVGQQS